MTVPLRAATLDELEIPLVEPFETSFGVERRRRLLILRLEDADGTEGWGECVAARAPLYSAESVETAGWVIGEILIPRLLEVPRVRPDSLAPSARGLETHPMARAAVEMALWDLSARQRHRPLAKELGGVRPRVEVGVSVGIFPTVPALVHRVGRYLEAGYRRVKLKVRPGWDAVPVAAVRREYPEVRLWVDANRAFSPRSVRTISQWAKRNEVELVEQPFPTSAVEAHARLRKEGVRVCLDESVVDRGSLELSLRRRAIDVLNVKPGRVGGHRSSIELARLAVGRGRLAWVGGMLETGIGRAHNVALASRPEFTLPADLSASGRYYTDDLIDRPFELGPGSTLEVPLGPGIGVEVDPRAYRRALRRRRRFRGPRRTG